LSSVRIRDVRKSFGSTPVIQGVSVDIADAELVVLVDPSGCGESTLLRTEIIALVRERTNVREGETVRLSLDASQAHFFETASGSRLPLA
jgi:ABC-type nitrate/sulfonate/bicarbonate transport system ATPase subunit